MTEKTPFEQFQQRYQPHVPKELRDPKERHDEIHADDDTEPMQSINCWSCGAQLVYQGADHEYADGEKHQCPACIKGGVELKE